MSSDREPAQPEIIPETYGAAFWIAAVVGWLIIAVGVRLFVIEPAMNRSVYSAALALGINVLHDAVFAPVIIACSVLGKRFLPRWALAPIAFGFFTSIAVLLVAWAPIRQMSHRGDNATVLPLDYRLSTLGVIATALVIAGLWALLAWLRARRALRPRRAA